MNDTCEVTCDEDEGGVDDGKGGAYKVGEVSGSVRMMNAEMKIGKLNDPNHGIRLCFWLYDCFSGRTVYAARNDDGGEKEVHGDATCSVLG